MTHRVYTEILGKTPAQILGEKDGDEITFSFSDGTKAIFYHEQECCESVTIEDITGDWGDLIGHPLLVADERTEEKDIDKWNHETWTFYTFRTNGGTVDVRWWGMSNRYYSESVDFRLEQNETGT